MFQTACIIVLYPVGSFVGVETIYGRYMYYR